MQATEIRKARAEFKAVAQRFIEGDKSDFYHLMRDFALWTHTQTGTPRYHGPLSSVPSGNYQREPPQPKTTLTDTEGAVIDRAVAVAKRRAPFEYLVFEKAMLQGREMEFFRHSHYFNRAYYLTKRATNRTKCPINIKKLEDFYSVLLERFLLVISRVLAGFEV